MPHIFRFLLGVIGLLVFTGVARAQNTAGYGDWQLHLPTNRPLRLADAGDRVYVATENAFYFLDKKLNTTQVLSRRDGLNDVGVAALAYDSVTRQTVVAYRNGNIDILQPNGRVRNLNAILRKTISGSKNINQVSIAGDKVYVSTSFGQVVVDLIKFEISDTYSNIGPGGAVVNVFDAAQANDDLFLATSVGLLRGRLASNLLDYRNWTRYQPVPLSADPTAPPIYTAVAASGGEVYAAVGGTGSAVYKFTPSSPSGWQAVPGTSTAQFRGLRASSVGLLIIDDAAGVRRLDRNGVVTTVVPPTPATYLSDAMRSRDGSYYVANYQLGLQRIRPNSGQAPELFVANGPETSLAFSVLADARTNKVNVFTGGYSERYNPLGLRAGFYEFANGQWTNFTPAALPGGTNFPDLQSPSRGTRTPDGTLYVGANGGGLLEWKGPGQFRRFVEGSPSGSPLINTFNISDRVEITDLAADATGKVWVVNRHLKAPNSGLFLFDPAANTWQTIPWVSGLETLDRIALDDNGYAWVSVSRKTDGSSLNGSVIGLFAVDPTGTNPPRLFSTASGLPDNQIYELAKDRRGYIWAATIKGVAVFNDPSGPFQSTAGFTLPNVTRGEGTGFPALFSEAVRTLAVDGGDRKWFGTDNGLWLFSPDADEALLHFTTANSPLPSNRIVDVKVNDKTGEVWVATDAGVVAYRGAASVTEGAPQCAAVFPNPVRPDFTGQVGITGVANNALVKITDVAGHLVYATKANGGTITWNLTNPEGQRVRSGIYLVLSSDADGKNSCVSKVAVLSK
ncbi:T9SS type A sorting domain-containing protein [Hymenobacter sp. BT664]|uniref:T9SS type A sorting domain-containing protein n=1 Tax=Hymenobacter montanus TaxID=2771359 RepID=A0A927BFY4_9BACT|nr:two-component regulator propeller domain-containing protein [Hymenobacter montanus]MBD2769545.1 T9SS type A sorting domain-containing protein [Hymenobacter montanus]